MKILSYNAKKQTAEIEWRGKIQTLSEEAVIKAGFHVNDDFPEEVLPDLIVASEEILCLKYLYDQVSKYEKTAKGYRDKLYEKGFHKQAVQKSIDRLIERGYIDDRAYAARYIELNFSKKGRFRLKGELMRKGVSEAIIEELLDELPPQDDEVLALAKKLSKTPPTTPEERAKLYRKLASRGFSYDQINRAINEL